MKNIITILTIATILCTSCTKEGNNSTVTGTTILSGSNVIPSNTSTATATLSYTYNANIRTFSYQIDYTGLTDSCTQFGITKASAGQTFPAATYQLVNFNTAVSLQRRTTASFTGSFIVEGQQMILDELRNGKYAVYLKSKAYNAAGASEVRGQIAF